jgi:hypothetical protein
MNVNCRNKNVGNLRTSGGTDFDVTELSFIIRLSFIFVHMQMG